VTGHSLGAALAAHFSSAMVLGQHTTYVANLLPNWPWHKLQLITYSAPIVGGRRFHHTFNLSINGVRIWVRKDLITQSKRHFHVGSEARVEGGFTTVGPAAHHPKAVRSALITQLTALSRNNTHMGYDLGQVPTNPPWREYDTFLDMYQNDAVVQNNLPAILTNQFADSIDLYKDIIREFSPSQDKQILDNGFVRGNVNTGGAILGPVASVEAKLRVLRGLTNAIDAKTIKHLGLCLVLRDLILRPNQLTMPALQQNVTIQPCLDF
jgi:hypothetical protein